MRKILTILGVLLSTLSYSQSVKQIQKAVKVFEKDYTKGINKLDKYMDKANPKSLKAWNTRIQMEYLRYLDEKEEYASMEAISGEDGEEIDNELMDYLRNIPYHRLVNLCRKATILNEVKDGDFYLRKVVLEVLDKDSLYNEKSLEYYEEAEDFFDKEDYELAILNYKKTIGADSSFYDAYIQLGTSFWNEEEIDSALKYYNLAKPIQPSFVEPYSYIINLLIDEELYFRAKKECIDAMCVYPGFDIKWKLYQVLAKENKTMDEHRLIRYFYPNDLSLDQDELNGVFAPYRDAKDKISKYCSDEGIIEENGVTNDRYLEVYSWKRALNEMNEVPEYLEFAVEMEEEGYLDCYVLVSLYHYDIYPQTKDFLSIEENKEKTKVYLEKYLFKSLDDY
ncbi:MAG: tetratricopeptide repeat protein [Putridiphycobacter sp.]